MAAYSATPVERFSMRRITYGSTMYFHLSELKVRTGQAVKKGELIGVSGSTGRTTGPHVHFGLRWHGARIDPDLLIADPAKMRAIAP